MDHGPKPRQHEELFNGRFISLVERDIRFYYNFHLSQERMEGGIMWMGHGV
jgi:hypothetical protein